MFGEFRDGQGLEGSPNFPKPGAVKRKDGEDAGRGDHRATTHNVDSLPAVFDGVNALRDGRKKLQEELATQSAAPHKYRSHGVISRVVRHMMFETVTLSIIALNAVWIGYDADKNNAISIDKADLLFQVVENFFCTYFSFEVGLRAIAFREKTMLIRDGWFVFDGTLVLLMIVETWIIPLVSVGDAANVGWVSVLRLLRLLRLTRMARLMRAVPELVTLIKGMLAAVRSVGSTLVLLVIFMYIFAIIFTQYFQDNPAYMTRFGTMMNSMFTLFLAGTLLDDCTEVFKPLIADGHLGMLVVVLLYIVLSSFTVFNMLVGVLCEVVSATAYGEREKAIITEVHDKMEGVYRSIDTDGTGTISKKEFNVMKANDTVVEALRSIGVEPKHLLVLSDTLFESNTRADWQPGDIPDENEDEGNELTFQEFLEMVCHLRPENTASVMDLADMRQMMRTSLRKTEARVSELASAIAELAHSGADGVKRSRRAELRDEAARERDRADRAEARADALAEELSQLREKYGAPPSAS